MRVFAFGAWAKCDLFGTDNGKSNSRSPSGMTTKKTGTITARAAA
jgi:hypothetical protein